MRISTALFSVALLMGIKANAGAQSYSIPWYKIAGGGGTSSGGAYSVSGTIGQADAGAASGGNYSLIGGFWSLIAVQTPGSPLLSLALTTNGVNTVILSWSAAFGGYAPEMAATLPATNWTVLNTNTYPITTVNGTNLVTVPVTGSQFYRLYHP